MTAAKTMTGARAQLCVVDPTTNQAKVVGIFSSCSWGLAYDAQPLYVLGRYSPAETVYTAQEAVNVSATGFKVVGAGAHVSAKIPYLKDLMSHEYMSLSLYDRQTNQFIMKVESVRPTGYSTSINARGVEEISVNFIGLHVSDESGDNAAEDVSATPDLV